jgi:hypothetical protein
LKFLSFSCSNDKDGRNKDDGDAKTGGEEHDVDGNNSELEHDDDTWDEEEEHDVDGNNSELEHDDDTWDKEDEGEDDSDNDDVGESDNISPSSFLFKTLVETTPFV